MRQRPRWRPKIAGERVLLIFSNGGLFVAEYYDRPFKDHPVLNGVIAAVIFLGLASGILIIGLWLAGGVPDLGATSK